MTVVQEVGTAVHLGRVVVGVLLGGLLTFLQGWANCKRDQNKELNVVAAQLLATTLRAWNARNRIAIAVVSLNHSSGESKNAAHAERIEAFAELREPSVLTAWNLARIQILRPALATKACSLVKARDRIVTVENSLELLTARNAALADFLAAVSTGLGVKRS